MRLQNYILMKRKREVDGKRIDYEIYYNRDNEQFYKVPNRTHYNPALLGPIVAVSMILKLIYPIFREIESFFISMGWIGIVLPYLVFTVLFLGWEYKKFSDEFKDKKNIIEYEQIEKEQITKSIVNKLYLINWFKFSISVLLSVLFLLPLLHFQLSWVYRIGLYGLFWCFSNGSIYSAFRESLFYWMMALKVVKRDGK